MTYDELKQAILEGTVAVRLDYLPANYKTFSIVFHKKHLAETVIQAVVGEPVSIVDPLTEHQSDVVKAMESSVWFDIYTKDTEGRVYTLDMQRTYWKMRNRNRSVYYAAKEVANQEADKSRYENLKQVSIVFIYEENTTPDRPAVAEVKLCDTQSFEVYTDLITLYEVNLNRITPSEAIEPDLITLQGFLGIRSQADLQDFVRSHSNDFAAGLVTAYIEAVTDDALLMKVERSEKYMSKTDFDLLTHAELKGISIGEARGEARGLNLGAKLAGLLLQGVPPAKLAEDFGRPVEEIEDIKRELNLLPV
jgi:hypothetical protein